MKTALVVIDVQESFRHRPYFTPEGLEAYLMRQQRLIDGAKAKNLPIVQVFHVEETGPFSLSGGEVRTMAPLALAPDYVIHKTRHSAFAGTGLDVWLRLKALDRLIISGIRTEQCCETTARHGSDLGFSVDFVTEATHTFPMVHSDGGAFTPAEIIRRTQTVLAGRFAAITTIDEALSRAG